jgi:type II secretory pathway pseudopilin PulG
MHARALEIHAQDADTKPVRSPRRATARSEGGFGLLELLIALLVLSVGLFAMLVVFSSAKLSLTRTDKIATAAVIADQQMERYRALEYSAIGLTVSLYTSADATYTDDPAYPGNQTPPTTPAIADIVGGCEDDPSLEWCWPTRVVDASSSPPSPDGRSYRVDTYIDFYTPPTVAPYPNAGQQKRVTVVVRDLSSSSPIVLARESSIFDPFTGSVNPNVPDG